MPGSYDNWLDLAKLGKAAPSASSVDDIADALNSIPSTALKNINPPAIANAVKGMDLEAVGNLLRRLKPETLSELAKKLPPELLNQLPDDVLGKIAKSSPNVLVNAAGRIPDGKIINAVKKLPDADQQSFMKTLKASASSPLAKKLYAAAILAGVSAGVLSALDKELAEEKKCINFCLPSNWDVTEYAGFGGKEAISYSTLDSIKAANGGAYPSSPGDLKWDSTFPLCAAPTTAECDTFCESKCKESITSAFLGLESAKDAAGDAIDAAIPDLPDFPDFPDFFPDLSLSEETKKVLKYIGLGFLVLVIFILIFYLVKMFSKKNNQY